MSKAPTFVWYELMTTDAAKAAAFYGAVLGWNAADAGYADFKYTIFTKGETRIAGMMELSQKDGQGGMKPGWIGDIGVADAKAMTARAKELGGKVLREVTDIPVGCFSVVADPTGAAFVLFQPGPALKPTTPLPRMSPGTGSWHELHAGNGKAAFDFYAQLFGWTKGETMPMGGEEVYQIFHVAGDGVGPAGMGGLGAIMTKMPDEAAPHWLYYFGVADIDAAMTTVREKGGEVLMGPHPVPGGSMILQCRDPQGALFALVQPPKA